MMEVKHHVELGLESNGDAHGYGISNKIGELPL